MFFQINERKYYLDVYKNYVNKKKLEKSWSLASRNVIFIWIKGENLLFVSYFYLRFLIHFLSLLDLLKMCVVFLMHFVVEFCLYFLYYSRTISILSILSYVSINAQIFKSKMRFLPQTIATNARNNKHFAFTFMCVLLTIISLPRLEFK